MQIGFDIISDLNLSPNDSFNWENKATSLYCIVAGNISSDLRTIGITLAHLSRFYQGIFYCLGSLEYDGAEDMELRTSEILTICDRYRKVAVLHHHVVIIDGIAILGCNGWYGNTLLTDPTTETNIRTARNEDLYYMIHSMEKLQKHLDVTKLLLVSNSVPCPELYFGQAPSSVEGVPSLDMILYADTQIKTSHWVFGTQEKIVDTKINSINYVNNPKFNRNPYWAKRIDIEV